MFLAQQKTHVDIMQSLKNAGLLETEHTINKILGKKKHKIA
jgi:hypothetical protein